jgi:hypothetical protein
MNLIGLNVLIATCFFKSNVIALFLPLFLSIGFDRLRFRDWGGGGLINSFFLDEHALINIQKQTNKLIIIFLSAIPVSFSAFQH